MAKAQDVKEGWIWKGDNRIGRRPKTFLCFVLRVALEFHCMTELSAPGSLHAHLCQLNPFVP